MTRPLPEGPASAASPPLEADRMAEAAGRAADYLKSLAHEQRLMILCHLAGGEKTVGELEGRLGARQAAVSQQLARLRFEGLVAARRDGKTVLYSLADDRVERLIALLYDLFCPREP
ncbi:transcriptional regulator, ArsR family [Rubellimicrobium thermophilum DSM 16684]|uniref:Transcriptional regulator, ArsR family n=1 Tax=Rubellimicrobium thermophilum DSM 16684 TaxID=1123069 RepID=S9QTJ4_9RHOB|nr:metalloregulator ArsR/SmtB family transcription factor [Rubellimicrobium thermophilum]EPX84661.1 transcriptional regulator, ArsR family [Rubellimicrobium thermophilum DSM 16684]